MNLQNGYKVIYEKAADGKRTFYASKNVVCDPTIDDKIIEATIGEYKLIYEKAGQFYGSTTGIPAEGDYCFVEFDKVFKVVTEESMTDAEDEVIVEPVETEDDEPVEPEDDEPVEESEE